MELEELIEEIEKLDRQKKKMLFKYLFETLDEQDVWDVVGDWVNDLVAENGYWDLARRVS
ncbi:MAG: hypothetical protein ACPLVI_05950 [Thermoplasmata archaeon]|jgi:hypothetical protein